MDETVLQRQPERSDVESGLLRVTTLTGETINLSVTPSHSILEVKAMIQCREGHEGTPPNQLVFEGKNRG